MTREELYTLVWQTPMSRLAKRFGLSDVGLRKICVKHDIPTPPLGYWAKLAHGKPVHQPPLSPVAEGRNSAIHLSVRIAPETPAVVATAQATALAREAEHPDVVVPTERPAKLHHAAAGTAKALRASRIDDEGFKKASSPSAVDATIGPDSIDRALCVIDALARAAEERGYRLAEHDDGVRIVVDDVPIGWRLYEIKDRKPHEPTQKELKELAGLEESRARWPSLYSSRRETKAYRSWDYYPSGRLAMTFTDATRFRWGRDRNIGHWHDRKNKRLEDYLGEALAALATGAVAINHRLSEEAEEQRRRAEEAERRRRAQARRERAQKRQEYLMRKAEEYVRYQKLAALAEFMGRKVYRYSDEPVDLLIGELRTLVTVVGREFERETLKREIDGLELYGDDDSPSAKAGD
ncbi:hypothetical protein [Chelativorans sp. M5D2P16]|uniref:hypothetical protein n=1 Tax=Chelativorans sp. M5D2P16 TaxID=3095678 RepID=UPI002ACAF6CD|nr:hypothetical protein [Chelativorans sp. M5D2P16]MDZ5698662.1 hypothetical protein [Chelativorans sp. M5D2P16]